MLNSSSKSTKQGDYRNELCQINLLISFRINHSQHHLIFPYVLNKKGKRIRDELVIVLD